MSPRVVCWFSCGAASAVATKLALAKYGATHEVVVVRTVLTSEHEDNERFAADCAVWFGQPVVEIRSARYADTWEVWEKRRYISGVNGALCTTELKKMPRHAFQRADDIQVFGYTSEERKRAAQFRAQNFEVILETPLIDAALTKDDCLALVDRAGIVLPALYLLGFRNNNCMPCGKVQSPAYWNRVRRHFPERFDRMAVLSRSLGVRIVKLSTGTRERVYLDELPPEMGAGEVEPDIECSLLCQGAESLMEPAQ